MSESPFQIVPATEKDIPLLLSMIRALAGYERMSEAVEATEDKLRHCLFDERPYAEAVLGYCGEAPAGFALFFHSVSTFMGLPGLYLEDLYVVPEFRARGLGRALLAHLARLAVERGCGRLEWSVLDWNEPAIGFYKKLGAVPMDEWTVYRMTGESLRRLAERVV